MDEWTGLATRADAVDERVWSDSCSSLTAEVASAASAATVSATTSVATASEPATATAIASAAAVASTAAESRSTIACKMLASV